MKVLVACEESQEVCKAFRKLGHEAYSCDIIDCSGGHPEWHIKDDVLKHLDDGWDLMIAHPPCTHLSISGAAWFEDKRKDGRQAKALEFFMKLAFSEINKICIENPVCVVSTFWRKPNQYIQPFQFGHEVTKKTGLWLKGLNELKSTCVVSPGERMFYLSGKSSQLWHAKTGKGCSVLRSKTFPGIAQAMAEQWGCIQKRSE